MQKPLNMLKLGLWHLAIRRLHTNKQSWKPKPRFKNTQGFIVRDLKSDRQIRQQNFALSIRNCQGFANIKKAKVVQFIPIAKEISIQQSVSIFIRHLSV